MAEGDVPRSDGPAFKVIWFDALKFELIEVEANDIGCAGLIALEPVNQLDRGDLVA